MKRLIYIAIIALFVFALSSCVEDCKECKIVTYDTNGDVENENPQGEYCGDDLDNVDGQSETDPSGIKTEWVCE
ncbi:MAG: hypothetical protein Kow0068_08580 [Marinilabiliales bacterium]